MPRPCTCDNDECPLCKRYYNDPRYRAIWGGDESNAFIVVPSRGHNVSGISSPRPWKHRVTAAIPHHESFDTLPVIVELLRLQTVRPYILVIDTGSSRDTCDSIEMLRANDLEIHYLKSHGWQHPSEPVAAAMDLALTLCQTKYLFCTHSDVFPRRRDLIEMLLSHDAPVVGYEMSDRSHVTDQWKGMVSHTATLLHMPTMRRIGAAWSILRACELLDISAASAGWPDTETCLNIILRRHGITPNLIGAEHNGERHVDANIDHVRSLSSVRLYAGDDEVKKRTEWIALALAEAQERIKSWRRHASTVRVR